MKRRRRTNDDLREAVGYVRVSTERQVNEGHSLSAQRERIAAWATTMSVELLDTLHDEGVSGASDSRPGFAAAVKLACERPAILVACSLSRLARSTIAALELLEQLHDAGAGLVSLTERIDTTSAAGKMMYRMLAAFAEFERDLVSERVIAVQEHRRRCGQHVAGTTPYGFDKRPDGLLVPNDAEQEVIRRIADLRHNRKLSYPAIVAKLNADKVPAKLGGAWTYSSVRNIAMNWTQRSA